MVFELPPCGCATAFHSHCNKPVSSCPQEASELSADACAALCPPPLSRVPRVWAHRKPLLKDRSSSWKATGEPPANRTGWRRELRLAWQLGDVGRHRRSHVNAHARTCAHAHHPTAYPTAPHNHCLALVVVLGPHSALVWFASTVTQGKDRDSIHSNPLWVTVVSDRRYPRECYRIQRFIKVTLWPHFFLRSEPPICTAHVPLFPEGFIGVRHPSPLPFSLPGQELQKHLFFSHLFF